MTADPSTPPFERQTIVAERTHGAFFWGNVLVQVWERATPASGFSSILRAAEERKRKRPDAPLWSISIIFDSAPMPDEQARGVASRLGTVLDYFVAVVEGTSFRVSMTRMVVSGMALLASKKTAPFIVAATTAEGVERLATHAKRSFDPSALEREIESFRSVLRSM